MSNQWIVVHGFGETTTSDWAGTHTLMNELKSYYPNDEFLEYTQQDFLNATIPPTTGKRIGIGNSYGGAALFKQADKNPSVIFDLFVLFDPVPNIFQLQFGWMEWTERKNVHQILSFRETASWLGMMAAQMRPLSVGMVDPSGRFTHYHGDWYDEYELPNDASNPIAEFLEHFTDLTGTGREWVKPLVLSTIASVIGAT